MKSASSQAVFNGGTCATSGRSEVTLGSDSVYTISAAFALESLFYGG